MIPSSTQEPELAEIPGRHISEIPVATSLRSRPAQIHASSIVGQMPSHGDPRLHPNSWAALAIGEALGGGWQRRWSWMGVMLCFLAFLKLAVG
jgi:hypothetical protein